MNELAKAQWNGGYGQQAEPPGWTVKRDFHGGGWSVDHALASIALTLTPIG